MPLWTWIGLKKGQATTTWPKKADQHGQDQVLGMPRYHEELCQDHCRACVDVCLPQAITRDHDTQAITLDYGKCVNCQMCIEACPADALTPTQEWAFGVKKREDLIWSSRLSSRAQSTDLSSPVSCRDTIHHVSTEQSAMTAPFKHSLHIRHVDAGSCNGCESELQALNNPFYSLERLGIFFTPSPRFADLLLVTGPVTNNMHGPLLEAYHAMPEPRWVMAVGTCAVSGGTNGGGYACHHGLEGILPVDLYLPGCPPNPAAIISALLTFLNRMPQRVQGGEIVSP
jgi:Ni,Fe-hydrogenase III small subunit/ferredoxin